MRRLFSEDRGVETRNAAAPATRSPACQWRSTSLFHASSGSSPSGRLRFLGILDCGRGADSVTPIAFRLSGACSPRKHEKSQDS